MTLRLRLQNSSLPYLTAQDNPAAFHPSSAERWLTLLYLPVLNFFLLLVPSPLTYDWQMGTVPMIGKRYPVWIFGHFFGDYILQIAGF